VNACESLFAKVMDFVLWESFSHIMQRHSDNVGVRTLAYAEQFRAMAFAQPTWRESLRDIEASLPANMIKRYAMGFHSAVRHSTLADTNDSRDWRIWSDLIRRARRLYASESLSAKLNNTVYALEYSMIDLCLNLFDWAPFRSIKAAVKTLNDKFVGHLNGVGMTAFVESTGGGCPGEHARLDLRKGDALDLFVGSPSAGQDHETMMAQVLPDSLDVPFEVP